MTINKATDVVREYFKEQEANKNIRRFFMFRVNGAAPKGDGIILVWCSHGFPFISQHHRVAVDGNTGEIVAVQKQTTDEVRLD